MKARSPSKGPIPNHLLALLLQHTTVSRESSLSRHVCDGTLPSVNHVRRDL